MIDSLCNRKSWCRSCNSPYFLLTCSPDCFLTAQISLLMKANDEEQTQFCGGSAEELLTGSRQWVWYTHFPQGFPCPWTWFWLTELLKHPQVLAPCTSIAHLPLHAAVPEATLTLHCKFSILNPIITKECDPEMTVRAMCYVPCT